MYKLMEAELVKVHNESDSFRKMGIWGLRGINKIESWEPLMADVNDSENQNPLSTV